MVEVESEKKANADGLRVEASVQSTSHEASSARPLLPILSILAPSPQ